MDSGLYGNFIQLQSPDHLVIFNQRTPSMFSGQYLTRHNRMAQNSAATMVSNVLDNGWSPGRWQDVI